MKQTLTQYANYLNLESFIQRKKNPVNWFRRLKILFLVALGALSMAPAYAQLTVTLGSTSSTPSTYYGPAYNYGTTSTTDNSRHAYLYTAAELGIPNGALITKLEWLKADAGQVTGANTFNILLKNTTAATLATGTSWGTLTTGATAVYGSANQIITGAANTYLSFPLSSFTYNGTNLQIMVDWVRATNPGDEVEFYANPAPSLAIGTASTATLTNTSTLSATTYGGNRPTIRISYIVGNDAGITAITSPGPAVQAGVSQPVTVTLKNFGTDPLTSAAINWNVDGSNQTPYSWTGNLASMQTANVTIGNFTFTAGGHSLTASSSNPNNGVGGPDVVTSNNATTINISACTTAPLSGNYTINSAVATGGTNFQTFGAAATVLTGCGVSGTVTFTVAAGSGPYNEQITLTAIPGSSATKTITFEGNGRTLTANPVAASPAIIKLDNADYVKFNNLNIVVNAAATAGWGVQLINGADFNTISNCSISAPLVTNADINGIIAGTTVNGAGNHTNNSRFENNVITGGTYGISLNGSSTNPASNNRITGNTIRDCDVYMIFLNTVDGTLVESNDISRPTRTVASSFQGIYMTGACENNTISKNRIHNTGALATAAYGINLRTNNAPAGFENIIKNNLIYDFQNLGNTYGMVNVGHGGANYYHNTIHLAKTNWVTNAVIQGFHQNGPVTRPINLMNNIIVIDAPGTSTALRHALFFNDNTVDINSNRNVLYVTAATNNGHIGYFSPTNYTTLVDWRGANSAAFDQNSVSTNPAFANIATGNYTPTNVLINNIGRAVVPPVTDDIDGGAARNAVTPDPGAYEFTIPCAPLAGNYTINSASATAGTNYQSFSDAILALNNCGVSSAVTFTVAAGSGPYNGPLEFIAVNGASATRTIRFVGTGNIISAATSTDNAVIRFDGARYFTLDSLTINATPASTTGGVGIQLINGADYNTITRSTINMPLTSTNTSLAGILAGSTITSRGNHTSHSTFSNNVINGGYYSIRINGNTGGLNAVGNKIINNRIRDTYYYNINLNDADSTLVEGNDISRPNRANVATFYGIYLNLATKNSIISKNRIHMTNGGTTAYGIYSALDVDAPVGQENIVKNNLIYDFTNTGSLYAIYNAGSDGIYYYHNTINLDAQITGTGLTRGFYQTGTASNVKFINNIIAISRSTSGIMYALYYATTASVITSNNNVLYITPATNHHIGYFGANQTTLTAWKAANSGAWDQNSVDVDPQFTGAASGDFTPANLTINNMGRSVTPPVADDINGIARNLATPDPGAVEFLNNSIDVGVASITSPSSSCSLTANEPVTIVIRNFGTTPAINIPLQLTFNGGAPVNTVFTGTLAPGASATYTFPTNFNLSASGAYTFTICTMLPGDLDATNNCNTKVVANSLVAGLPQINFETASSGLNGMRQVTNSHSTLSEGTGASFGTGSTKGLIMAGVTNPAWSAAFGSASAWVVNPDNFAGAYICFSPSGGSASDSLWLTFDLKQLFKGANANTNFRVTINGLPVGGNAPNYTYRPPFAGSGSWEKIKLDLTAYKNDASIEIGFESSVSEEYANGTGPANLVDNIRVVRRIVAGVKDAFLQQNLTVSPNPSAGLFQVELPKGSNYQFEISDLTGKVIKTQNATSGINKLNLEGTAKGIYLLKVTSENGIAVKKLVVE